MTTTVFELSLIITIDKREYAESVTDINFGLFSSLEKAEDAMLKSSMYYSIQNNKTIQNKEDPSHFCYIITQKKVDGYDERGLKKTVERTYLRDTTLNDENLESIQWPEPFKGRPKEKIRFNCGDIVKVLDGESEVNIGVVVNTPKTPEQIEEIKQVITRKYGIENQFHMPIELSRDCYKVIPIQSYDSIKSSCKLFGYMKKSHWLFHVHEMSKYEDESLKTIIHQILDRAMVKSFYLRFRITGLNDKVNITVGQKYNSSRQQPKVAIWYGKYDIVMSISENPEVLTGDMGNIPLEIYEQIVRWIALNHKVLTRYWFNEITPPVLFEELQKL